MEDILEAILNEEIVDETDMFIDVVKRIPVVRRAHHKRRHSLVSPVKVSDLILLLIINYSINHIVASSWSPKIHS